MSIENFCTIYPPDGDVRVLVANIKKTTDKEDSRSLVVVLAEQLAKEGQDGMRKIINILSQSNTMFELDRKSFGNLPVQDRDNMFKNYSAFVFGNLVVSLERTLVNGEYDHEDFCERYNIPANSLQLDKVEAGTEKREKISVEKLTRMFALAKKDPTFAIFFEEEGVGALPRTARQFLEDRGLVPIIRKDILSIYKPRAKFVIA